MDEVNKMNGRMKAAFLYGPSDVRIEEVEIPSIGPGQALVRVEMIGICPSDVRCVQRIKEVFPLGEASCGLSGHEWAGEVVRLMGEHENIGPGDRVVVDVLNSCGRCKFCLEGAKNLCLHKGYNIGGFAEFVVVPANSLIKIPDDIRADEAFMTEPISCCLNAFERSTPWIGMTMLVIGDGPLGLVHLQLAKSAGLEVIVSGHHDSRLNLASELGADRVVNSKNEDLTEAIMGSTHGAGVDIVMLAVGGGSALEEAFNCCTRNGLINMFAGTYPKVQVLVDPYAFHNKQITLTGSTDSQTRLYVKALKMISQGSVRVTPLISHRLPLDQLNDGFKILRERKGNKVLIEL